MSVEKRLEIVEKKMETVEELLINPTEETKLVFYLLDAVRNLENVNLDLTNKWNTAVAYFNNKGLVAEYNNWVDQLEKIQNPQMKQLFMMKPIDEQPVKEVPTPPQAEACEVASPFHKGVKCSDIKGHEGEVHMGVDEKGIMWKWTDKEDLGQVSEADTPEVPMTDGDKIALLLNQKRNASEVYKEALESMGKTNKDTFNTEEMQKIVAALESLPDRDPTLGNQVGALMQQFENGEKVFNEIRDEMGVNPEHGMTDDQMEEIIERMKERLNPELGAEQPKAIDSEPVGDEKEPEIDDSDYPQ